MEVRPIKENTFYENYYVLDSWRFLLNNDFIIHWIG